MKRLIFLMLLWPAATGAQEFTKQYVTSAGDTIRMHDPVRISDARQYRYISLHSRVWSEIRYNAAQRYLTDEMPGKTYNLTRLSRLKRQDKMEEIGIVTVVDPSIHRGLAVEYCIWLEDAIKAGEISLVKKSKNPVTMK